MFFKHTSDIQHKMNICGKEKEPFLFAVNFEMTEGFFIKNPLYQTEVLFKLLETQNYLTENNYPSDIQFRHNPINYNQ